jgi:hypothetical protein
MIPIRPLGGLAALLALGAAVPPIALARAGDGWEEATLKHRGQEDFQVVLPEATKVWRTLGDSLVVNGVEFPLEVQGDLKFEIDTDGDETVDEAVRGNAGFVKLAAKDSKGESFEYSVRFRNDGAKKWSWAPSGVMQGKVRGTIVSFIDRNGNGRYNDLGQDAYAIGSDRGAAYLSDVINIGDTLYEVEVSENGATVKTQPYTGPTGRLIVPAPKDVKGDLIAAVFTKGASSFNFAGASKGIVVPAGEYTFASGHIERGGESVAMSKGEMAKVTVPEGGEFTVSWGGPVSGFIPNPTVADGKARVVPTFELFGSAGEAYGDFMPAVKSAPKILAIDKESGKVLAKGTFPAG